MAYHTVRRDWLRRQIEAGKMEAKCDGRYTDDYAWDAATDFGRTEWMPALVAEWSVINSPDRPKGLIFPPDDFKGHGRAWKDDSGEITLTFGYRSYSIRPKAVEMKEAA